MSTPPRRSAPVVFLHGLESGPTGSKALALAAHFDVLAVDLDTSAARASAAEAAAAGQPWVHPWPSLDAAFATPMARARAAIGPETRVIVGSSFGGAVLERLLAAGDWRGPSVLLASAGCKLNGPRRLPAGVPVILIHGRQDDVVPVEDSRWLAAGAGPDVQLYERDDDHRLSGALAEGQIVAAVAALLRS
jgi:pimeloyl-ACP methyl ester carboxylesterase